MKRNLSRFAAIVLLSATSLFAQDSINDLVRDLTADKPAQRAPEQWDAAIAKAIDAVMADLGSDDANKRAGAQSSIERLAFSASRPGAEPARAACSKAIAAKATGDTSIAAKVWLIRQLQRIGLAEAVPQLATLLGDGDAQVRESARRALMQNSAPEAGQTLRNALAAAEGPWRIALINALAARVDPADVSILLKEAASNNDDIRIAALRALGNLGDKSAAAIITAATTGGSPLVRQVATEASLTLAEALVRKGDSASALAIYKATLGSAGHVKCAAIVGIGRAGTAADLPLIFDNADGDARLRGACADALATMKGIDVTAAIAAKAKSASADAKPTLLQGLARRGDKSTASIFIAACEDENEAVKVEAIRGVGMVGDASAVPLLLKLAAGTGPTQDAARWSLACLKGDAVNQAIMSATASADAPIQLEAIRATVARHIEAAAPALLKAAQDAKSPTRAETIKAVGSLASADALAPVAAILLSADADNIRQEAANALANIAGREADPDKRSGAILQAMAGAPVPAKLALLNILPRVGGSKSLNAVREAVKADDAKVKDAAIRALAGWQDIAAAPDLLAIAKSGASETHQVLALRGCINIVREARNQPSAERARLLVAALEAARRPDEKRQAISALGDTRSPDALKAVMPFLADAALAQEAAQAAARIGRDIANDQPELVKEMMPKVLAVAKGEDAQRQAKEGIERADQKLKQKTPK